MKEIILEAGQEGIFLIRIPDNIADNALEYQMKFDKWLFDKNNDHGYWHTCPENGELALMYNPSEAFIKWLNEYVIDNEEKAIVVKEDISVIPKDMIVLHF